MVNKFSYLSDWMILTGVEYINVETQRGDIQGNLMMVEWIQNLFH